MTFFDSDPKKHKSLYDIQNNLLVMTSKFHRLVSFQLFQELNTLYSAINLMQDKTSKQETFAMSLCALRIIIYYSIIS